MDLMIRADDLGSTMVTEHLLEVRENNILALAYCVYRLDNSVIVL